MYNRCIVVYMAVQKRFYLKMMAKNHVQLVIFDGPLTLTEVEKIEAPGLLFQKIRYVCVFRGPPDCPPLLCWQWVPIQITSKIKIVDPVLSFCRDNQIQFYQIHTSNGKQYKCFCLQKVELSFSELDALIELSEIRQFMSRKF